MQVRKDLDKFLNTLPKDITLVAATKYLDAAHMKEFLKFNVNNFGENRTDAFLDKYEALKDEKIIWHFIGHLQRNKALPVINKIDYLHSLDSLKLADLIEKNVEKPLKCFVEVSINEEATKNGVKVDELDDFIERLLAYKKIELVGLMMMSIKYSDEESLNKQFSRLVDVKRHLEDKFNIKIPYLSMGMSDDYHAAIKNGATHIRLGRILLEE
ncbi:MAG: YggS family pyridoxal phosphate-dependent enzyme [Bacilli bacterium]|nr:YggS family pyridoxal phosphate-dependent enzyme [Bacilli bacterium]